MADGALQGLRLIEIGAGAATEICGQLLADHGCDVIRVLAPAPRVPDTEVLGRNKRCLALDFCTTAGSEVLAALLARADFLLLGSLPANIVQSVPDSLLQAMDDPALVRIHLPAQPDARQPFATTFRKAAFAAFGAMLALHHRHRTGAGQLVRADPDGQLSGLMSALEQDLAAGIDPVATAGASVTERHRATIRPQLSATPGKLQWPPDAGQAQTAAILAEVLDMAEDDLMRLRQAGAI